MTNSRMNRWMGLWLLVLVYFNTNPVPSVTASTLFPYVTQRVPSSSCYRFYSTVYVAHLNQFWYSCREGLVTADAVVWMTDMSLDGQTGGAQVPATRLMDLPVCRAVLMTDPISGLVWIFCDAASSDRLIIVTPPNWNFPTPATINLPPGTSSDYDCQCVASSNPTKTTNGSVVHLVCNALSDYQNVTILTYSNFTSSQPTLTTRTYLHQECHLWIRAGEVDKWGNLWIPCGSGSINDLLIIDSSGRNSSLQLKEYCTGGVQDLAYDEVMDDLYIACAESGPTYTIHHPSNVTGRVFEMVITTDECYGIGSLSWDASLRTLTASCVRPGVLVYRPNAATKLLTVVSALQCASPGIALTEVFSVNGLVIASCASGLISVYPGSFASGMGSQVCSFASQLIQDTNTGNLIQSCVLGNVSLAYLNGADYTPFLTSDVCDVTLDVILDNRSGTMVIGCLTDGILIRYSNGVILPVVDFFSCTQFESFEIDLERQTVYAICTYDGIYAIQYEAGTYSTLIDGSKCPRIHQFYLAPNSTDLWLSCNDDLRYRPFSSLYKYDQVHQSYTAIFDNSSFCRPDTLLGVPELSTIFIYCYQFGLISFNPMTLGWHLLVPDSICPVATLFHINSGRLYYICGKLTVQSFDLQFALASPSLIVNNTQLSQTLCDSITSLWIDPNTNQIFTDCTDRAVSVSGTNFQCYPSSEWVGGDCQLCSIGKYRDYDLVRNQIIPCQPCASGSVAPQTGAVDCMLCPPGSYAVSSVIECQPCPRGTYQSSSGQSGCRPCPSGYYGSELSLSSDTCDGPCLPGYWCGEGSISSTQLPCGSSSVYCPLNSSFPLIVSPGYFSDQPAIPGTVNTYTTQTPCPIGSECDGSGLSRLCGTGRYQNLTGQSLCTACEVGRYASSPGLTKCHDCEPGSYTDSLGSPRCTLCSPGEYTSYNGSTICSSCTAGTSAGSSGYSLCDQCTPGRYTNQTHTLQCQPCPTGFKQSEYGSIKCDPCPAGEYAFDFTSTECQPCQPGRYSDQPGSSTCLPCSQGSASNQTGRSSPCELCLPGTFQSQPASLLCIPCTIKTYSSTPGSLACQDCSTVTNNNRSICYPNGCQSNTEYDSSTGECRTCLLGQTSNAGFSCGSCPSNTYTPYLGSGCVSCTYPGMDGIQCAGGFPSIISGYWAYQVEMDVNEIPGHKVLIFQSTKCPEGFCQGAELQPRITNSSVDSSIIISSFQPSQCTYPRVNDGSNVLCGGCADGYIPWSDSCVSCTTVNGGLVVLYLFLSFLLVLFLSRSSLGSSAGYSVVLLYFAQTAMLEVGPVRGWLAWIGIVNFNGTNGTTGTCLAPWNQYQQTLLSLLMPIFLLAELIFIACIRRGLSATRWNMRGRSISALPIGTSKLDRFMYYISSDFTWSRYVGASMSILLFCYTQATSTCIRYLTCISVGDAKVVFSAPTMDCRSDTYKGYLVPVILVLIIYVVGFPLGILAFLWSRRTKLADRSILAAIQQQQQEESISPPPVVSIQPPNPSDGGIQGLSENGNSYHISKPNSMSTAFVERWGPLFQMYSPTVWFWMFTELIRRALFVIMNVSLVDQPHARGLAFLFLNFISLLLQQWFRPFVDESINAAEIVSHIVLISLSGILTAYTPPYTIATQIVMFFLIVPTIGFFIFRLVHQKATSLQEQFLSFRRAKSQRHLRMVDEEEANGAQTVQSNDMASPSQVTPTPFNSNLTITRNDLELTELQSPSHLQPTTSTSHAPSTHTTQAISVVPHPPNLLNPFVLTPNPLLSHDREWKEEQAAPTVIPDEVESESAAI